MTQCFPQLNPRQTERTIMRIRAIKIANTISFIFMFCSHIFLRILVPEFLKSCACLKKWTKVNRKQKQLIFKIPIICFEVERWDRSYHQRHYRIKANSSSKKIRAQKIRKSKHLWSWSMEESPEFKTFEIQYK